MSLNETLFEILDACDKIVIAYHRKDNSIIFMNSLARNTFHVKKNSVTIKDMFSSHSEDYERFLQGINMEETLIYRPNKTCFPASIQFIFPCDDSDEEAYALAFITDETKDKENEKYFRQKERELRAARNIKDEFVANMTHELRTPVNGIQGHAKNLYRYETDAEKKKTLEIILNCCSNMNKLINDIMDYTKMQAQKLELDEISMDIRKCIASVIDTNSTAANEKGLSLSFVVSPEIPQFLTGDRRRLEQILNNLVSNAIKFTTLGYVRVEAYLTRQEELTTELSILVIDTGIGIADDEREQLFQSFSQVDSSIGRRFGGTGLGLYVSRQLANMMGGDITFESVKGKGSTFSVSLLLKNEVDENASTDPFEDMMESMNQVKGEDSFLFELSEEELYEISNCMERLMMCIEMGSWQNAENIVESVKSFLGERISGQSSMFLKLLMAIRNEDYDKSRENFDHIKKEMELLLTKD